MGTVDLSQGIHPPVTIRGLPDVTYVTGRGGNQDIPAMNRRANVILSLRDEISPSPGRRRHTISA
jgi:hypothetical protein